MLQGVRRDKVVRVLIRLWDSDDLVVESKFQRAKPELAIGSKTALGIQWLVITSLGMSGFDLPVRVHLQLIAAPSTGGFSMGGSGSADFAAPLSTGRFEETQSGCNPGDER